MLSFSEVLFGILIFVGVYILGVLVASIGVKFVNKYTDEHLDAELIFFSYIAVFGLIIFIINLLIGERINNFLRWLEK